VVPDFVIQRIYSAIGQRSRDRLMIYG